MASLRMREQDRVFARCSQAVGERSREEVGRPERIVAACYQNHSGTRLFYRDACGRNLLGKTCETCLAVATVRNRTIAGLWKMLDVIVHEGQWNPVAGPR
jgi:hypothetical protein